MVNDLSDSPTYSDTRLQELVIAAAQLVNTEVNFPQDYTIDLDELVLSPDPTTTGSRDDNFINLVALKSACILDQNEARTAASKGISISDAGARIDLRGSLDGRIKLLQLSWCKEYTTAKLDYEMGRMSVVGQVVLSPFRTDALGAAHDVDFR